MRKKTSLYLELLSGHTSECSGCKLNNNLYHLLYKWWDISNTDILFRILSEKKPPTNAVCQVLDSDEDSECEAVGCGLSDGVMVENKTSDDVSKYIFTCTYIAHIPYTP